jgi:signal peptidase I
MNRRRRTIGAIGLGMAGLLAVLFVRHSVVEAFRIPAGSMAPTLLVGDHILVNKWVYGLRVCGHLLVRGHAPARGEVIVFRFPPKPELDFIKRIVGVAGDRVELKSGALVINGRPVDREPVVGGCPFQDSDEGTGPLRPSVNMGCFSEQLGAQRYRVAYKDGGSPFRDFPSAGLTSCPAGMDPDCRVPADHVFVLGDNRDNSHDSRFWGPVPNDHIKGRLIGVWFRNQR